MSVQPPGRSAAEEREARRALASRAQTALIYGIGQIALGALVAVLAYETAGVAPLGEQQGKALLGILAAFALYAVYRGVRQVRDGLALRRELHARTTPRPPRP